MSCHIYSINLDLKLRLSEGIISKHTDMSKWLKDNGDSSIIYEIWKINGLHS